MGKFLVANEDSNLRALEFKVRPFTTCMAVFFF